MERVKDDMELISPHTIISILVRDQDEALRFYVEKLGLEKRRDITYGPGLRLLTVAPIGQMKPELALACPDRTLHGEERVNEVMAHVGQGTRTRRIFITHNCWWKYEQLCSRGVHFVCAPTPQNYGKEAIFVDPYGNSFTLLEAAPRVLSLLKKYSIGTIGTAA